MANFNIEEFIKGLSPELQEKALACKTDEEFNNFIAENDIELPEEALDSVSGGINIGMRIARKNLGVLTAKANGLDSVDRLSEGFKENGILGRKLKLNFQMGQHTIYNGANNEKSFTVLTYITALLFFTSFSGCSAKGNNSESKRESVGIR